MTGAFVLVLVFLTGPGSSTIEKLWCPDQKCVDNVLTQAPRSQYLQRLRVFRAGDDRLFITQGTPFPPIVDESFNQ